MSTQHPALFGAAALLGAEKALAERSLFDFLRMAWPHFDPSRFAPNWHLEAIAEHLEAVTDGEIRRLLINVPPRFGKAVEDSIAVLTPAGWVRHGDLEPGDSVFGPDGAPTQIIAVSPHVEEVVPVKLTNGETICCHLNHEWTVYDRQSRRWRTLETRQIRDRALWSGDRAMFQLPDIAPIDFPAPALLPVHPYALGAWLGDGSTGAVRISHAGSDVEVVEAVTACGHPVSTTRVHPTTGVHYADFCHSGLARLLRQIGVFMRKHIPALYLRSSIENRKQLLAGLIDTDGSVDAAGRVTIGTCNVELRDGILDLCTTLGLRPYLATVEPHDRGRAIKDRQPYFHIGFQPNCEIPCRIPRKRVVAKGLRRRIGIRSIGDVRSGRARSIQVERPDGLYLVGKKLIPTHNTGIVAVAWPVWTWAQAPDPRNPLVGPGVRFLAASYGAKKAQQDGVTARRLIASHWFQSMWGDRVQIAKDRDNQEQYDTTAGGSRISTGIPESLGKGGMIRIVDDPHKTDEIESTVVRAQVIKNYDEIWRTRSNDPGAGSEVIIMQRQAENDISGHVLEDDDVVHLCLPVEYDPGRHCVTVIGFEDPRRLPGELLWPDRFDAKWVAQQKAKIGPYAWACQYDQFPQPRGGGIIQRDWWQEWAPKESPPVEFVVAALDTAVKDKEESDYYALTVWAIWRDPDTGTPRVLLLNAWRRRAALHEIVQDVVATCRKLKVDQLVIEDKAHGWIAQQEILRMTGGWKFGIAMFDPRRYGDKTARLLSVQHLFAEGLIYAPVTEDEFGNVNWRTWADEVITEVSAFPRGKHDDLTDSCSMALRYLRDQGFALRKEEHAEDERRSLIHKPQRSAALPYAV